MKRLITLLLILTMPAIAIAKENVHIETPVDQECYECHGTQMQVWQDGKHGLMNVKCVVCHGSTDKNFVAKPDIYRCRGCHGEKVMDVENKLPKKVQSCFLCHDHHALTNKFHEKGGKQ